MNAKSNFLTYLFVLIAGVLLIVMRDQANILQWIVIILGAMFAIPAIINIIVKLSSRRENRMALSMDWISSVGAVILGVIMMVWPAPFAGFFVYVLAAVLIIVGAFQIYILAVGCRPLIMPWWLYILPALIIIAGVVLICSPLREVESTFTLITGIALVASALNALLIYLGSSTPSRRITEKSDSTVDKI